MRKTFPAILSIATLAAPALAALALSGQAHAQPRIQANLSGTYRCVPEPSPCPWQGQTMSITQSGTDIALKNEQGEFAAGKLTSDTTLSVGGTWNSLGVVLPDHTIQWSNGTEWRKQ